MNKKYIREIAYVLLFFVVFSGLLTGVTLFFYPKWTSGNEPNPQSGFYLEEENSLDVLLFGSCNMYTSFNPALFWERTGVTSYVRGCPDQMMGTTYYYLEEALKTQKPKVIAVEALFLTNTDSKNREHYDREAADYMPLSISKLKMAKSLVDREVPVMQSYDPDSPDKLLTYASYIFPLLRYHSRDDLSRNDLTFFLKYEANKYNKGAVPFYSYATMDDLKFDDIWNGDSIRDDARIYVPKIKELCDKNGIEFFIVKSPNKHRWTAELSEMAKEFAESQGVEFVDMEDKQFGDFYEWDYQQGNRLNIYGMRKFTYRFGDYLVENCKLTPTVISEDCRTLWEESVEKLYKKSNEKYMSIDPGEICKVKSEGDGLMVRWNIIDDCSKYAIYKKDYYKGDYYLLAETDGETYLDRNVEHNMRYWYYVVPLEGEYAGQKSTVYFPAYVEAPTDLSAQRKEKTITLNWNSNGKMVDSYSIQRRTFGSSKFSDYATVDGNLTTFVDKNVKKGITYFYRIMAVVKKDEGKLTFYSDSIIVKVPPQK